MYKSLPVALLFASILPGQVRPRPAEPTGAANLPVHKVAPNDLISLSVYDEPELTRAVRVDGEGMIHLPMLKAPVKAAGLLPVELEGSLAGVLKAENILIKPLVTVTVLEYNSGYISVNGAVRKPITFQALSQTRLLDALARAEGLTSDAGPVLLLSRGGVPDGEREEISVDLNELLNGSSSRLNYSLSGGEQIRVPEARKIYVMGNVRKPGPIPVREVSESTVMKALSIAQGVLPYAAKEAWIYRKEAGSPMPREIRVPLKEILRRKAPDMALMADDLLYIPDNTNKRITIETARTLLTLGSGAISAGVYAGVR